MTSVSDGTNTIGLTYWANGLISTLTSVGRTWTWTNKATTEADPVTASDPITSPLYTILYENASRPHVPTKVRDYANNEWAFGLNTYGQTTSVDPPGTALGNLTVVYYEPPDNSIYQGYPKSMSVVKGTAETDLVTFDGYDTLGDLTLFSTYPVNGDLNTKNTTQLVYDGAQRLTRLLHPNGKSAWWSYYVDSPNGNRFLNSTTDENGTSFSYQFCQACGALEQVSGPSNWQLNWDYDGDGDLTRFLDARANSTYFRFGSAGEFLGATYPDGTTTNQCYDNLGRVRQVTNGRGTASDIGYDTKNRVATITGPSTQTFTYNDDDTLASRTNYVAINSYSYYPDGKIHTVSTDFSPWFFTNVQTVEYTYNGDGTRATMTWKNNGVVVCTWNYSYDAAGRVSSITNSFSETASWTYDGEGKITSQHNGNNTWNAYFYDGDAGKRGWVTSMGSTYPNFTYFSAYILSYDQLTPGGTAQNSVGNLTGVSELNGTTVSYGFDSLYRLTSESRGPAYPASHTYQYDLAGNRTYKDSTQYTFDAANKITNNANATATYDADGNLATLSGSGLTYRKPLWNPYNVLTRFDNSNGTIASQQAYDGFGQRVWTQVTNGPSQHYVYDGDMIIGEITKTGTTTGYPSAVYTWGPDGLISERLDPTAVNGAPKSLWYHYGPQGETRQLTDLGGVITDWYVYDAYGMPVASVAPNANPFRYGGQFGYYTLPTLNVICCGARWYDPQMGRRFSRDPAGYEGGANLYEYCAGDPVGWIDPSGLDKRRPKKKAYIFVGDTSAALVERPFVAFGVWRDKRNIANRFRRLGYEVIIDNNATESSITKALKSASAMAFIGHQAFEGAIEPKPDPGQGEDNPPFMGPFEFSKALNGRKLEWAIIHACDSDRPELRDALVGKTGRFEGSVGQWNPVLSIDFGNVISIKGKKRINKR